MTCRWTYEAHSSDSQATISETQLQDVTIKVVLLSREQDATTYHLTESLLPREEHGSV